MKPEHVPEALKHLDDWVNRLAALLPQPVRQALPNGGFVWRFPHEGLDVLLIGKAVRISSAIGAAWELAKLGYSTESGALLRLVDDFSQEIQFMAESHVEGRETKAQADFRDQFFRVPARSLDEFLEEEKQYFVSRKEIKKAARRLAEKAGQDATTLDRTSSFIAYGLNQYVHGAYGSAMELYHGGWKRFMVRGDDGSNRDSSLTFTASKTTEALHAVELAAMLFGASDVADEIKAFLQRADPYLQWESA